MPPDRWAGAAFSFGPRAVLMSAIETALVWSGFHDPRDTALESINAWGDRIGHTPVLGLANAARLAKMTPYHETAAAIATGNGTAIVRDFIAWASAHGVRVVGGLPAEFAASPVPEETRTAIRDVFVSSGARFLDPPEREGYPPSAFFDTPDHLNEVAQIAHSRAIAAALAPILAPARAASR